MDHLVRQKAADSTCTTILPRPSRHGHAPHKGTTSPNGAVATAALSIPLQLSERSTIHPTRLLASPAGRLCRLRMSLNSIVAGTLEGPSTHGGWRCVGRALASGRFEDALLSLRYSGFVNPALPSTGPAGLVSGGGRWRLLPISFGVGGVEVPKGRIGRPVLLLAAGAETSSGEKRGRMEGNSKVASGSAIGRCVNLGTA